jgi:hypothetical protein
MDSEIKIDPEGTLDICSCKNHTWEALQLRYILVTSHCIYQ